MISPDFSRASKVILSTKVIDISFVRGFRVVMRALLTKKLPSFSTTPSAILSFPTPEFQAKIRGRYILLHVIFYMSVLGIVSEIVENKELKEEESDDKYYRRDKNI